MERCPAYFEAVSSIGFGTTRKLRCQKEVGHDGQCTYHRRGGQGGTISKWWGANPRPVWYTGDYSPHELEVEIWRLRHLCEANGIDWVEGVTK